MALKAKLTKAELDALPELLQKEYRQHQDYFVIDTIGVDGWNLEDVQGLRNALQTEKGDHDKTKAKIGAFAKLDVTKVDEYAAALDKVASIANWTAPEKTKEQIEAVTKQLQEKYTKEIETREGRIKFLQGAVSKKVLEAAAIEAISKHKGNAALLLPHVMSGLKAIEEGNDIHARVVDPSGNVKISMRQGSTGQPMSAEEWVETLKAQKDYLAAFEGSGSSGGGTSGSSGSAGGVSRNGVRIISEEDARNPSKYRSAREAAAKAGEELVVGNQS